MLSLEGALKRLEVVLAKGLRAQMLAGPAAALRVDAQAAAVLVTWHPQAGRKLSGDSSPPSPEWSSRLSCRQRARPGSGCGCSDIGHMLQVGSCQAAKP